jgi:hypothetical protein
LLAILVETQLGIVQVFLGDYLGDISSMNPEGIMHDLLTTDGGAPEINSVQNLLFLRSEF